MELVNQSRFNRIHPKKFALWTAMVSMIMLFSAFTSAYIVKKSAGNWLSFPLPDEFTASTFAILLSSATLHFAYRSFKQKKYKAFKILLSVGTVSSLIFIILQYAGWLALNDMGIFAHTNQSASFLAIFVGVHALHVFGGIAALIICLAYAFGNQKFEWSPKRQLRLELVFTYWHFVDVLWLYLLGFLIIQQ
jgi:cytochrome c oxidase subunit 3